MPNPTTEAELKPVIETPVRYDSFLGYIWDRNNRIVVDQSYMKGLPNPQAEFIAQAINDHSRQAGEIERLRKIVDYYQERYP